MRETKCLKLTRLTAAAGLSISTLVDSAFRSIRTPIEARGDAEVAYILAACIFSVSSVGREVATKKAGTQCHSKYDLSQSPLTRPLSIDSA